MTSDVLIGAGLSSSAAFETLIGTILSYMYLYVILTPVEHIQMEKSEKPTIRKRI